MLIDDVLVVELDIFGVEFVLDGWMEGIWRLDAVIWDLAAISIDCFCFCFRHLESWFSLEFGWSCFLGSRCGKAVTRYTLASPLDSRGQSEITSAGEEDEKK